MPSQPGSAATFSQPEMPRPISLRTRSRMSRVGQGGDALVHAERQESRRQDRGQGRRGGRVRVLVGGDVEAFGTGRLQARHRLAGAAPDGLRPALEVRDLEPGARSAGADRRDRLVERVEQPSDSLRMWVA